MLYAGTVVVDRAGLLALQLRDDRPDIENPGMITAFGGLAEPGESAIAAAARELGEELGLAVSLDQLQPLLVLENRRGDGGAIRCELFVLEVSDVGALHALEGQRAEVGPPMEFVRDPRLTRTCRLAVEALLGDRR